MDELIDDYVYINFTNFDKLIKKKINEKTNNQDYTLIEKIDNNKKNLTNNIVCINLIKNNEICISIDKNIFIENIQRGYPYNKIWDQFLIDVDRSKCYFNNNLINHKNSYFFKNYLESKFSREKINNILMLFTQTVMAYPFEIIQNSLHNRYLAEIPIKTKSYFKIFVYNICQGTIFNIYKRMRIFKLNCHHDDVTTEYINIKIEFNLDTIDDVLMKIHLEK